MVKYAQPYTHLNCGIHGNPALPTGHGASGHRPNVQRHSQLLGAITHDMGAIRQGLAADKTLFRASSQYARHQRPLE